MNNKGRRMELTKLKHKKRCRVFGIEPEKHYCYKAQGKPCSCIMCSGEKYNRNEKHKVTFKYYSKEYIEANRCSAYDYML